MKDRLMAFAWWVLLPIVFWGALITALCAVASADILVVEMDEFNNSIAVVEYEGSVVTQADVRWDGGNNFGACGNETNPLAFINPESQLFEIAVHGKAGWVDPCSSFPYEPNAEILVRPDRISFLYYNGNELIRRHAGLTHWDVIPGDANLDGAFNSADLVQVMQFGEYETQSISHANWYKGDWDLDGRFTTSDLIDAFSAGHYEQPAAAVASVPEPSAIVLFGLGCLLAWRRP